MSEEKNDKDLELSGHEYDGISELDNPLPTWWVATFAITIIFAFHYYLHYEFGGGPTLKQELMGAMEEIEKNKQHEPIMTETEETLMNAMDRADIVKSGANVYGSKCAACHGTDLQGQIGPNLTDKFWIHGKGTRMALVKVIRDGVSDKGMPSWMQLLSKDDLYAVVAFILSRKDSNPKNPKAPQGESVE